MARIEHRIEAAPQFARFRTAVRSRSGRTSGIGLSIGRVLAEQLGGEVSAGQEHADGSVTIALRMQDALPPAAGARR